jgi:hypothetical protein
MMKKKNPTMKSLAQCNICLAPLSPSPLARFMVRGWETRNGWCLGAKIEGLGWPRPEESRRRRLEKGSSNRQLHFEDKLARNVKRHRILLNSSTNTEHKVLDNMVGDAEWEFQI